MSDPAVPSAVVSAAATESSAFGAEEPGSDRRQIRYLPLSALGGPPPSGDATLRSLFDSVLEFGVLQPLLVRPAGAAYVVIDGAKRLAVAQAAGLRDLPCVVLDVGERDALSIAETVNAHHRSTVEAVQPGDRSRDIPAAVFSELQDAHGAVRTCLSLSASAPDGLRRRVATRLMESELQRIGWIAEAMALFGGVPAGSNVSPLSALSLLRKVTSSFKADCELGGIDTRLSVEPVDLIVTADEGLLVAILTCTLGATLALIHGAQVPMPEMRIGARASDQGVLFSFAQNAFGPDRYSPPNRGNLPSGPTAAAFALAAVRRASDAKSWRIGMAGVPGGGATFDLVVAGEDV